MTSNVLKKYGQLIIIGVLTLIILFNLNRSDETPSTRKQKVIVPEVIGKIDKPIGIINHKGKKDSIVYKPGMVIRTENPINQKMAEELIEAMKDQDTLKVLRLYLKSIEEREETHIYKDKNQTIEVYNKIRGELLEQKISKYTIDKKEIVTDVVIKEPKFAIYTGASLQYNNELKLIPAANLGVQVSKRLIITGSYGLDKSIQAGVLYKIKL